MQCVQSKSLEESNGRGEEPLLDREITHLALDSRRCNVFNRNLWKSNGRGEEPLIDREITHLALDSRRCSVFNRNLWKSAMVVVKSH